MIYAVMEHGYEHGELIGVYSQRDTADAVALADELWSVVELEPDVVPERAQIQMAKEIARLKSILGEGRA